MSIFIGFDLAWKSSNESGICWVEGDSKENLRCIRLEAKVSDPKRLAAEAASANAAVVAVDAPLLCTDKRWVDSEIGRKHRFHPFKIAARPAKAAVRRGESAGTDLGEALKARGFNCDPPRVPLADVRERSAVEVYPHTIHVRLFDLEERLPYKPKKGRRVAFRRTVLQQYQDHLRALIVREAPKLLEHADVERALAPETAQSARGKSIKRLDDTLDGLTCALAAWLIWKDPERWEMIGDLNGYIVVPKET